MINRRRFGGNNDRTMIPEENSKGLERVAELGGNLKTAFGELDSD